MHLAYPNVLGEETFIGCGRYRSLPLGYDAPTPGYHLAGPNYRNITHLLAAVEHFAPGGAGHYPPVYEQDNAQHTRYFGSSLDLAYLLAALRCVRRLYFEAIGLPGDVWCTGKVVRPSDQTFMLDRVDQVVFRTKLRHFLAVVQDPYQPEPASIDRVFLVPALNFAADPQHQKACAAAGAAVLSLEDVQELVSSANALNAWAQRTVITIRQDQLPQLIDMLFAPTPLRLETPQVVGGGHPASVQHPRLHRTRRVVRQIARWGQRRTSPGMLPGTADSAAPRKRRVRYVPVLLLGVGLWGLRTPAEHLLLQHASHLLTRGNIPRADAVFRQLSTWGTRGTQRQAEAGLTTAAFMRGEVAQALDLASQGRDGEADSGALAMLRCLTLVHQEHGAAATTACQTASTHPQTAPCPRAIAHLYLGRLHATQVATQPQALDHYNRAMESCPSLATVYTDTGALLSQLGRYEEARRLYERARHWRPDDALTTVLVAEVERRQRLEQDAAHRQQIKVQLQELADAASKPRPVEPAGDPWTSRPLTLAFEPFHQRQAPGARGGAALSLEKRLWDTFQRGGRTVVVERERLEVLLSEQQLCLAGVCDPAQAPRFGRLVGARLIVLGELLPVSTGEELSVRVLDTTTGVIQATASAARPLAQPEQVAQLAEKLLRQLRQRYPLQGRIRQMAHDGALILNIGGRHGVTPGLLFDVFVTEAPPHAEVYRTPVGQLQVVRVEDEAAATRQVAPAPVEVGWQVKEHVDP